MIYSRFGSEVAEVLEFDEDTGQVRVRWADAREGEEPETVHVSELKADGGIHEIAEAGRAAASKKQS